MTHYYQEYILLLLCISMAEENPVIMMDYYVFLSIHSYGSTLNEDNFREATVSCRPENTFAIESADATLILGRRGNSHIPLDSELLSIDNKLQPYVFQTHAGMYCIGLQLSTNHGGYF